MIKEQILKEIERICPNKNCGITHCRHFIPHIKTDDCENSCFDGAVCKSPSGLTRIDLDEIDRLAHYEAQREANKKGG